MESITLQKGGTIISSGDAVGQIQFAAPSESDGGASRYVIGQIYAHAEGAFNASSNAASIVISTSAADNLPASGKIKISHEGHILPLLDNAYDLGSPDLRFRDLYVTSEVTSPSGNFDYIFFNTGIADVDLVTGQMNWNYEAGTVELGLTDDVKIQIGQTVLFRVKNSTGSALSKGQAVYASGVLGGGQIIQAAKFTADESVDEVRFIGLMTDDLANGEDGFVNHFGHIKNVDLRTTNTAVNPNGETWAVGDILYVDDSTPGGLTKVPPQDDIYVALVLETGQNGELFVRITDPGHMTDLHDVNFSGLVDNNLMVWNSGSDYWEPSSGLYFVDGDLGIGIAAPSGKLHIYDNNSAGWNDTSFRIENPASPNYTYFDIAIGTSTGYGDNVWFKRNGVNVAGIYSSNMFYHYQDCVIRTDKQFRAESNGNAFIELLDSTNDMKISYLGNLRFYSSYAEKMVLDVNGNLGIGTTSPSYKLHVVGDISANANNVYAGGFAIYGDTNNKLTKSGNDFTLSAGQTTTDVHLGYYDGGTLNKVLTVDSSEDRVGILNTTPAYTLDVTGSGNFTGNLYTGGNLGVGTTSPSSKLHVMGGARLQGDSTNTTWTSASATLALKNIYSTPFISFHTNAGARIGYFQMDSTNAVTLGVEQNLPLRFTTNNLDRMRITADGNVGIGTTSPSYKLDVNGDSNLGGNVIVGGNLTVNGTTISTNVDTIEIQDPIITLGLTSGNIVTDDSYDRGVAMVTNDGTAFMGWDNSADKFVMLSSGVATNGSGNYDAGTYGDLQVADITASGATFDGNVGIETVSPSYTLDVNGSIGTVNGVYFKQPNSSEYRRAYSNSINDILFQAMHIKADYSVGVGGNRGTALGMSNTGSDLGLYTASNERIRITSGGNVGIGDSSPSYKLDVAGTTAITPTAATESLILGRNTGYASVVSTASNELILDSDSAYVSLNHYSSDDVILGYGGGNVGIGTATPLYKLQVEGTFRANNASSFKEEVEFLDTIVAGSLGSDTDDTVIILNGSNYLKTREIDTRVWGSSLVDGAGSANHVAFWSDANTLTYDSSQLYWDSSNNRLGLGTASPAAKLHVEGDVITDYLRSDNYNLGPGGAIKLAASNTSTSQYLAFGKNAGGAAQNFTEHARFTTDGDFGIGTATPSEKLHVAASNVGAGTFAEIRNTSTSANSYAGIKLTTNYNGTLSTSQILDNWTGAGVIFQASRDLSTSQGGFNWLSAAGPTMMVLRRASSNNWLGLNTTNPTQTMDIRYPAGGGMALLKSTDTNDGLLFGDMAYSTSNNYQGIKHAAMGGANDYMMISDGTNTFISAAVGYSTIIGAGGNSLSSQIQLKPTEVVVNDNSSNLDFRVESNNNANMLFVDGVSDMVGIGTGSPNAQLNVYAAGTTGWKGMVSAGNENYRFVCGVYGDKVYFGGHTADHLAWADALIPGGKLGIGTTGPVAKTHIYNNSAYEGLKVEQIGTSYAAQYVDTDGYGVLVHTAATTSTHYLLNLKSDSGNQNVMRVGADGKIGIGTASPSTQLDVVGSGNFSGDVTIDGHLSAATKSFLINHPTREGHKLQYGSLESPYHGVRLTGRAKVENGWCVVKLPEYINELVHNNNDINIQITNIKHSKVLYVDDTNIANNEFTVKTDSWFNRSGLEFFWTFTAVRKDVKELQVEF